MALIICKECGKEISSTAQRCPHCGYEYRVTSNEDSNRSPKDWLTTLLLCIFTGGLGIHSFYAGKTLIGVLQLITLGGLGIWALVDLIMIVTNNYNDGEGRPITN